jgi:phospholipase C
MFSRAFLRHGQVPGPLRRANPENGEIEMHQQQISASFRRVMAMLLTLMIAVGPSASPAFASSVKPATHAKPAQTATPIQYLVVIFGENVSFDHYFGTYPVAANPKFENKFTAKAATPSVNGLSNTLLTANPNSFNLGNGTGATNPFRLDVEQAATADQNHAYTPEQQAFDLGLMDLFPEYTGTAGPPPAGGGILNTNGLVMGYFDGNTVTAMWNYAQNFALNDNHFGTTFGPSTPGLVNLVSGQTNGITLTNGGVAPTAPVAGYYVSDGNGGYTLIGDADPLYDVCSNPSRTQAQFGGQTIADLLNTAGVTWGAFMGGFNLNIENPNGTSSCQRSTKSNITGVTEADYTPHHSLFAYWASVSNPTHARPCGEAFGTAGCANHNYDINDFYTAVTSGQQPAVSFLKAPSYQDAHPGYSDPIDEQNFVVGIVDFLENPSNNPNWNNTAVVVMYDDSDGWYDHQMSPIVNNSQVAGVDELTGSGFCGGTAPQLPGIAAANAQGRCGYGPRSPFLVISPWAKDNFVDHTLIDQTSLIHFIEDNWLGGQRIGGGSFDAISGSINNMFNFTKIRTSNLTLCLNPTSGEKQNASNCGL